MIERKELNSLMRGLDPRIQSSCSASAVLDGRDEPGHEEEGLKPHITRRAWQEAELALVTRMWGEGYSASQIAHRLEGRTRNAVIGCVSRLNLPERKCRNRAPSKRSGTAPRVARKRDPQLKRTRAEIREAKRLARSRVWLPLPGSNPVSLVERGLHQCAWPIGETLFCGEPKLRARPYCGAHCRLAYRPPEEIKL